MGVEGRKGRILWQCVLYAIIKINEIFYFIDNGIGYWRNRDDDNKKLNIFKFLNSSFWPFNYIHIFKASQIICFSFLLTVDFVVGKLLYNS